MNRTAGILAILVAASRCPAQQQDAIPPEIREKLAALQQAPPEQWLELSTKAVIPYLNDQLWPLAQDQDGRLRAQSKPTIDIRMDDEDAPFTAGSTVTYPGLFLAQAQLSAFLLAHDVYVDNGRSFPVLDPVLQHPYAVGLVMSRLDLSSVNIRTPVFLGLLRSLTCYGRDERCNSLQALTWSATLTFALGHEYGHIAAGDSGAKEFEYSLSKELAADAFASRLMKAFGPGILDDESRRDFYGLGPVALLRIHGATLSTGTTARADIDARINALLKLLPNASQAEYEALAEVPQPSGMSSIRISWSQEPDWIAVDGVIYKPQEIAGVSLRVTSGLHQVLAVRPDGLAWSAISAHGNATGARLVFKPFSSATPDKATLASLRKDHRWGDILLQAAKPGLQPVDPEVSFVVFEALHGLHLEAFLPSNPVAGSITASQRRTIGRWVAEAQPLASWQP